MAETKDVHTASGGTLETKGVPGYVPAAVVNDNSTAREREYGEVAQETAEDEGDQKAAESKAATTAKRSSSSK